MPLIQMWFYLILLFRTGGLHISLSFLRAPSMLMTVFLLQPPAAPFPCHPSVASLSLLSPCGPTFFDIFPQNPLLASSVALILLRLDF
ncbi:hypothetical protein BC940DRAFT_300598 [Gongronella butleri]|nr:hypothetical protein BC940DRAFT_300598 [Gongronella butleri]